MHVCSQPPLEASEHSSLSLKNDAEKPALFTDAVNSEHQLVKDKSRNNKVFKRSCEFISLFGRA